MHPIDALPILLSLDVTAGLVKQGLRAQWTGPGTTQLAILGASNTTPIVLTVAAGSFGTNDPRTGAVGVGSVHHVVVAGVTGNTAANKLSEKDQRNEAWIGVLTSPTTIALYDLNVWTGALIPSVGNGVYAGGGTVSRAFVDGAILVGREKIGETSATPRCVMVPASIQDGPADATSAMTVETRADDEHGREELSRPLRTDVLTYEVHAWGGGASDGGAFGPALLIAQQVKRSALLRFPGVVEIGRGTWPDQHPEAPQRLKLGHEFVFTLGFRTPITAEAVEFAPAETVVDLTMALAVGTNDPEEA